MLKLKGITKDYAVGDETVHALKGIDLEFRKSEFVAVLGHSGCGKTTLLNIIGGLDQYTDGDLIINGRSTKEYTDRDWDTYRNHSIGFVFQSFMLIPTLNALENVELPALLRGESSAESRNGAKALLEQLGLGKRLDHLPAQLSGGEQQRVALARAFNGRPDVLFADEPTGNLDSATGERISDLLFELNRERGTTLVLVTHDERLAHRCRRLIRLESGRLIDRVEP